MDVYILMVSEGIVQMEWHTHCPDLHSIKDMGRWGDALWHIHIPRKCSLAEDGADRGMNSVTARTYQSLVLILDRWGKI